MCACVQSDVLRVLRVLRGPVFQICTCLWRHVFGVLRVLCVLLGLYVWYALWALYAFSKPYVQHCGPQKRASGQKRTDGSQRNIQHVLFRYPQQWGAVFGDLAAGVMGGHARTACLLTAEKVKIQLDQLQSRISSMKLPLSSLNPSPSEQLIGVDVDTLMADVSRLCPRDSAELDLKFPKLVGDQVASLSREVHCAGIVCGVFDKRLHTISGACRKLVDSHFLLDVIFGPKFGIWGWGTSPRHARVAALREIVTRARDGGVLEQACSLRLGHQELIEVSQADKYFSTLLKIQIGDVTLRLATPLCPPSLFAILEWKSVEHGNNKLVRWRHVVAFCNVVLKRYARVIRRCLQVLNKAFYLNSTTFGFPLMLHGHP